MYNTGSEFQCKLCTLDDNHDQCMFISCNKCTTLVGDDDRGRGYKFLWAGRIWETLYFRLCCEPKMSLKNEVCSKFPSPKFYMNCFFPLVIIIY